MVHVRRLVAVDLSGLGPKIIIPEFVLAVLGAPALGVLTLRQSTSVEGAVFGVALIGIGVNYVPMLIHAIDLVRRSAVDATVADQSPDRRALYAKYRRQSLWLVVPFVVAVAALSQMRRS